MWDSLRAPLLLSPSRGGRTTGAHLPPLRRPPRRRGPSTYRAPLPSRSASSGTPGAAEGWKQVTAAPLPLQPPTLHPGRPLTPGKRGRGSPKTPPARRPRSPRPAPRSWREGSDPCPAEDPGDVCRDTSSFIFLCSSFSFLLISSSAAFLRSTFRLWKPVRYSLLPATQKQTFPPAVFNDHLHRGMPPHPRGRP